MEHLAQREIGGERQAAGQVGQKAVAALEVVHHGVEGCGIGFGGGRDYAPLQRQGQGFGWSTGGIGHARKVVEQVVGVDFIERKEEGLRPAVVHKKEERLCGLPPLVHLRDGGRLFIKRHK